MVSGVACAQIFLKSEKSELEIILAPILVKKDLIYFQKRYSLTRDGRIVIWY